MLIHHFDPATGQYQASQLAMTDPVDPDRWLLPAFTTDLALPERPPRTWPFLVQGQWELREDWRGIPLYRRDNGESTEILFAGVTLAQAGATLYPRPDDEHKWGGESWIVDDEAVAARVRREAFAQLDTRMNRVREKLFGKTEAYTAGLLSPFDVGLYKAWAAYGMALGTLAQSPEFPTAFEWPAQPDEDEVAKQVAADLEAQANKQVEQAAAEAQRQAARMPYAYTPPPEGFVVPDAPPADAAPKE